MCAYSLIKTPFTERVGLKFNYDNAQLTNTTISCVKDVDYIIGG